MADIYREVKYILSASCNKEVTREKSIRKEVRYKHIQRIKD